MDPLMKHLETSYTTHDGLKLYLQAWMPELPKAAVLIVHGLGEHSSRYAHLAKKLVDKDIAVFTFDGRGHGKSCLPKPDAYFSDHEDYLKDIDALVSMLIQADRFGTSVSESLAVHADALRTQRRLRAEEAAGATLGPATPFDPDTIIARARDEKHALLLREAGASVVVPETLESSLKLTGWVLETLGVPSDAAMRLLEQERERRIVALRDTGAGATP